VFGRMRENIPLEFVVDLFVVVAAYVLGLGYMMLEPFIGNDWFYVRGLALALPMIAVLHLLFNKLADVDGQAHGRHRPAAPSGRWAVLLRVVWANIAAFATLFFLNLQARGWGVLLIPFSVILYGSLLSLFGMALVRFIRSEPDAPVAQSQ
jgi:hypothetical protein